MARRGADRVGGVAHSCRIGWITGRGNLKAAPRGPSELRSGVFMPPTLGRTFRRFGHYPTMAGEETSRTLFRAARGHTFDRLPTQRASSLVEGPRLKPQRAPKNRAMAPTQPLRCRFCLWTRGATGLSGPKPAHNTNSPPWARQTRCSEKILEIGRTFSWRPRKHPHQVVPPKARDGPRFHPAGAVLCLEPELEGATKGWLLR